MSARRGERASRAVTGAKIFAPLPDTRSRWWKDKDARHTCRITGEACEYAYRCQYSVAEWPRRNTSARERLAACSYAIDTGFAGSSCRACSRRKACVWTCWFYKQ